MAADPRPGPFAFSHTYAQLPAAFWRGVEPTPVKAPQLLAFNDALAAGLGLARGADAAAVFGGNTLPPGAQPLAMAYAGHQFGHFVPQLGDGRAILLGEVVDPQGQRFDVQLKGAGPTPFSRNGDGRAAIGPVLREFLVSEAMHALGVPTTRALAVVATGESVFRGGALPGAVLTRVAASHVRVGTFQYFAAREDHAAVRQLVDFVIARHYPELAGHTNPPLALLQAVAEAQARLVSAWLQVGFVHGVMNTDNMTISGETIDYGPCAFIDAYDPGAVFSSIDREGRYAFANQREVAKWNLARFAESLLPVLIDECGSGAAAGDSAPDAASAAETAAVEAAVVAATEALAEFDGHFETVWVAGMRAKLGLGDAHESLDAPGAPGAGGATDEVVAELARDLLQHLRETQADYTNSFRELARIANGVRAEVEAVGAKTVAEAEADVEVGISQAAEADRGGAPGVPPEAGAVFVGREFGEALAGAEPAAQFPAEWIARWLALGPDPGAMNRVNPIYIPRNHVLDAALEAATDGDLAPFTALLARVTHPYEEQPGGAEFANPAPPGSGRFVTYCGT